MSAYFDIMVHGFPEPFRFESAGDVAADTLDGLSGARVVGIKNIADGVFHPRRDDNRFFIQGAELSPGVYKTVLAASHRIEPGTSEVAIKPTNHDILRASECVLAYRDETSPLSFLQHGSGDDRHDIAKVVLSQSSSLLKYMVAISPDVLTVCIDSDPHAEPFLRDSFPATFKSGVCSSAALALANLVPFQTLFEFCNKSDSLIGADELFELVDADDAIMSPIDTQPTSQVPAAVSPNPQKKWFNISIPLPSFLTGVSRDSAPVQAASPSAPEKPNPIAVETSTSKTPAKNYRKLVFTGHSYGGAIAQIATVTALDLLAAQNLPIEAMCISFSAPYCMSAPIALMLPKAKFVNLCSASDASLAVTNLAVQVALGKSTTQSSDLALDIFLDSVKTLSASHTGTLPSEVVAVFLRHRDVVEQFSSSFIQGHPTCELYPAGTYGFLNDGRFDYIDLEDSIMSSLKNIVWGSRFFLPVETAAVLLSCFKLNQNTHWTYVSASETVNAQQDILPTIDKCDVVYSKDRVDVVITGMNLESVTLRNNPSGFPLLRSGIDPSQLPSGADFDIPRGVHGMINLGGLLLGDDGFEIELSGGHVFISRSGQTEIRFILLGVKFISPCEVMVRTDFGVSVAFKIQASSVSKCDEEGALSDMYSTVDPEIFRAAYIRGMMSLFEQSTDPHSQQSELLDLLVELEKELIGTNRLQDIISSYRSIDQMNLTSSILPASKVFSDILTVLSRPLQIQCESRLSKVMRKFLGAVGSATGAVFVVVAAVVADTATRLSNTKFFPRNKPLSLSGPCPSGKASKYR